MARTIIRAVVGWPTVYYFLPQLGKNDEDHPLIVNIALASIVMLVILRFVNKMPILLKKVGLLLVAFGTGFIFHIFSCITNTEHCSRYFNQSHLDSAVNGLFCCFLYYHHFVVFPC
ncbi:MAG: putative membrane protein [Flavobacterium sp.]|jgi:uncharacterized membrane protein